MRNKVQQCLVGQTGPVLFVINMFYANSHFKHIVEFINQAFVKNGAWVGHECVSHTGLVRVWIFEPYICTFIFLHLPLSGQIQSTN